MRKSNGKGSLNLTKKQRKSLLLNCTFFDFQTVNIPNAYEDPRFDESVDEGQIFKHKSILCMAIKNSLGQIIGVIQLINKFDNLVRNPC